MLKNGKPRMARLRKAGRRELGWLMIPGVFCTTLTRGSMLLGSLYTTDNREVLISCKYSLNISYQIDDGTTAHPCRDSSLHPRDPPASGQIGAWFKPQLFIFFLRTKENHYCKTHAFSTQSKTLRKCNFREVPWPGHQDAAGRTGKSGRHSSCPPPSGKSQPRP